MKHGSQVQISVGNQRLEFFPISFKLTPTFLPTFICVFSYGTHFQSVVV